MAKRLGDYLFRGAIFFFSLLPMWIIHALSSFIKWVLWDVFRYRKDVVIQNLSLSFPEKTEKEIGVIADQFYLHLSDILLETIKGFSLSEKELKKRFVFTNPEILDAHYENGESVLILGSHHGNWEWGVLAVNLWLKHQVVGIYKPLKNKYTDATMSRKRSRWGLLLASMQHAGRAFVRYRKKVCAYVLIADQGPSDMVHAYRVPFLHRSTPFLHGPDKLAQKTGYPVYMYDVRRIKRGYYEVSFSLLDAIPQQRQDGDIVRKFAQALEGIIREDPANWLWSHKRWKR